MKIFTSNVFVGDGDSPDDREVKWTFDHVDLGEFKRVTCTEGKHVYVDGIDKTNPKYPDLSPFWYPTKCAQYPIAVTMGFTS